MKNSTAEEGKTTAIISYLTWIGTIIAYFMNKDKKNSFASFHIRQNIGISLLLVLNSIVGQISGKISLALLIFITVLWIIGFIGVIQGKETKVPLLGDQFQEWFKNI